MAYKKCNKEQVFKCACGFESKGAILDHNCAKEAQINATEKAHNAEGNNIAQLDAYYGLIYHIRGTKSGMENGAFRDILNAIKAAF